MTRHFGLSQHPDRIARKNDQRDNQDHVQHKRSYQPSRHEFLSAGPLRSAEATSALRTPQNPQAGAEVVLFPPFPSGSIRHPTLESFNIPDPLPNKLGCFFSFLTVCSLVMLIAICVAVLFVQT